MLNWPESDAILDEALALPPAAREAFVTSKVADPDRRTALMRVLAEAASEDGFLDPAEFTGSSLFRDWQASLSRETPGLAPGDVIGIYTIIDLLGRGGMGEVYRAHDPSLGRDVAIKLLPAEVAGDSTRLARFRREARLLASLNHPHIGAIYSVVEDRQRLGLVLELVEGPTLAERLEGGPLAIDVALATARQIAEAMEAAHAKSVVHRDLKPANIKLSATRQAKVLDFGIAKALGDGAEEGDLPSLTGTGHRAVLGTAAYMSPEQARGETVDHRADVWAFGCILYEMLTGARAFPGASVAEVLARVLEREPDLTRLPARVPEAIRRLLRRALEKDPRRRLGYIGDAVLEIDDGIAAVAATGGSAGVESRRPVTGGSRALLAVAAVIAAAAGMAWWASRPAPGDPLLHLALPIPASHEIVVGQLPALAVSGDGRTVVYRARQGGVMRLFEHRLTEAGPVVVPGSDDVAGHALSPDGQSVAFVRNGQLFRSVLGGGEPVLVSALSGGATLSWGTPDVIIASGGPGGSLRRVPASGGTAVPFTTVDVALGHMSHGAPQLLPDGHTVLFSVSAADGSHIAVTDLDGGDVVMLTRGREPRLLPSGLLVFARDRSLWVVRFDVASRSLVGEPVQVLDGVERSDLNAFIHFAVSDEGTLFYIPWREDSGLMRLAWHDRQGRELELEHEARGITRFSLSPDGARVALAIADGEDRDVWVLERARKALARLTSDPVPDSQPIWSPDGTLIAFRSDRDGGGVFVRRADGASGVRRLTRAEAGFHIPYTFTPDGGRVLFTVFRDYVDQDIASVGVTDLTVEPVLQGKVAEVHPALSPDGRWLLYQADESGRFEVYLRPYPNVADARWQVSVGGGMSPTWRADGRELFFASNGQLMAATFRDGAPPRVGVPETLFPVPSSGDRLGPQFDVSRDGTRVLVLTPTPVDPVADRPQVRIVQRWATALARAVPAS